MGFRVEWGNWKVGGGMEFWGLADEDEGFGFRLERGK
jgi:hypothetical protein